MIRTVGNADIFELNIEIPEGGGSKELALEMTFKADLSMMELIVTGFAEEENAGGWCKPFGSN